LHQASVLSQFGGVRAKQHVLTGIVGGAMHLQLLATAAQQPPPHVCLGWLARAAAMPSGPRRCGRQLSADRQQTFVDLKPLEAAKKAHPEHRLV
jgi:hypothetical protein